MHEENYVCVLENHTLTHNTTETQRIRRDAAGWQLLRVCVMSSDWLRTIPLTSNRRRPVIIRVTVTFGLCNGGVGGEEQG